MPGLQSSTNGGAGKASRKPRVAAIGNPKAWADAKTLNPRRNSNFGTAHKSRVSMDGGRTTESKMVSNSGKMRSRGNKNVPVLRVGSKEKSGERPIRNRMDFKNGSRSFEPVSDMNSGRKRKRSFADPGIVEDRVVDGFREKPISKSKHRVTGLRLDKGEKKVSRGKSGESDSNFRSSSVMEHGTFKGNELRDRKIRAGNAEGADRWKRVRGNGLGSRTLNTSDKRKISLRTVKDLSQRSYKKNDRAKKSLVSGSDMTDELQPKKKKRVIRIDPHDTSNKRINDGIAHDDNTQAKTDLEEKDNAEMSKNAQFRAIRPSPSILTFVEENLLGRRRDIEFRRAGYNTQLSAPLDNIPLSTSSERVPLSTSSERERIEVPVFRNKLEFFAAAKISSSFPSPDLPEIAFAGRSNVGKSSLLNALTRQWGVVRISDKPGLTQSINFFKLGPKLSLVDLPGYGFAYAKEEVKEAWEELVKEYVTTRVSLKRVCVLVDTKWGMKPRDLELIDLMERSQTKYQIVLTKTDTVFPIDVARRAMQIEENLKAKKSAVQPLMMVSSKTGAGIRSLRTVLANVARLVK
ncbi:P-loop containing nucleoside triphosphate hydrolases superfamily protein [Striga hermonthica]|uniref:P-loop containing nucleoside triphosphate hydrolases superfamily protein n=1 Tax=Striga hermonthica TaxID=68872 RepID=A0A9N7RRP5_STRHE|nr:P-loop containing nucleoside triphosphate hydrolases superfamily protein [Striga hermonthica]